MVLDPRRPIHVTCSAGVPTVTEVSVAWLANVSGDRLVTQCLSPKEQESWSTISVSKRRLEWLAGRMAAKCAVRAHYRVNRRVLLELRDIAVSSVATGSCAGKPTVNFPVEIGISHSGEFAVAVCSEYAVGIDIERNRRLAPLLADALGAGQRLPAMPPILGWVCREAVLKYFGFGLGVDPRDVRLTHWRADGFFGWTPGADLRGRAARMRRPRRCWATERAGYAAALVW